MAYVDQEHDQLKADKSVWEIISGGNEIVELGGRQMNSRAYVSRFNFSGTDQEKKVGNLSGGERNRVHLAMMLKEGANLLLLDEPTNDLGRKHAAGPGRSPGKFRRLRRHHLARPLVPGSHRHAHSRLRGRLAGLLVRGQLQRLRRKQEGAAG